MTASILFALASNVMLKCPDFWKASTTEGPKMPVLPAIATFLYAAITSEVTKNGVKKYDCDEGGSQSWSI